MREAQGVYGRVGMVWYAGGELGSLVMVVVVVFSVVSDASLSQLAAL
jgi:hypothetical protein